MPEFLEAVFWATWKSKLNSEHCGTERTRDFGAIGDALPFALDGKWIKAQAPCRDVVQAAMTLLSYHITHYMIQRDAVMYDTV